MVRLLRRLSFSLDEGSSLSRSLLVRLRVIGVVGGRARAGGGEGGPSSLTGGRVARPPKVRQREPDVAPEDPAVDEPLASLPPVRLLVSLRRPEAVAPAGRGKPEGPASSCTTALSRLRVGSRRGNALGKMSISPGEDEPANPGAAERVRLSKLLGRGMRNDVAGDELVPTSSERDGDSEGRGSFSRVETRCNLPVQFSRLPSTRLVTSARGSRRQRRGDSGLATVFERRRRGGRRDELEGDEPQVEANGLKRLGSGGGGGDAADIQEAPGELDLGARRGRAG
ncbi:hypothetical protein AAT19DRAFT_9046 [Rhodotorula toruloides]|uniref:Uncharacterized protein n=1 Tax=Rhodotorula toruloides TaxID=5286 RepID=A0A2T0AIZ4_RHOTO|nr:hypothetical protein AAT19DRAFT_9046 [Rhodotorula toruloides]